MKFSELKLTPLTIIIALCVMYGFYLILGLDEMKTGVNPIIKGLFSFLVAVILFLTDILFRRFVENRKWLWLIQGSFIILIIFMMIIFQTI
jgi:hypothetical protein